MHNKFFVRYAGRALFFPQSLDSRIAKIIEKIGSSLWNKNGGLNIIIAQKMIFAPRGRKIRALPTFLEKLFKPKPVIARNI
jgi:hypothetical protein